MYHNENLQTGASSTPLTPTRAHIGLKISLILSLSQINASAQDAPKSIEETSSPLTISWLMDQTWLDEMIDHKSHTTNESSPAHTHPFQNLLPVEVDVHQTPGTEDIGKEITGIISHDWHLGQFNKLPLSFTPSYQSTYQENFFGVTGIANHSYGLSLQLGTPSSKVGVYVRKFTGDTTRDDYHEIGLTWEVGF